ncbi:MAG: rod-binding protein [Pseudomonadota bacterium]
MDVIGNRPVSHPIDAHRRIPAGARTDPSLREAAAELEVTFLAEMLRQAGLGDTPDGFGGGTGEDTFSSLLTREWARKLVDDGGIGLTERLVTALMNQEA